MAAAVAPERRSAGSTRQRIGRTGTCETRTWRWTATEDAASYVAEECASPCS